MRLRIEIDIEKINSINIDLELANYIRKVANELIDYEIESGVIYYVRDKQLNDVGFYFVN